MRLFKLANLGVALCAGLVCGFANTARAADEVEPGLVGEYFFDKSGGDFSAIEKATKPNYVRVEKQVNFPDVAGDFYGIRSADNFCARWIGKVEISKPGKWTFFCESDDGSRIFINGKLVVENGGSHPMEEKSGTIDLTSGVHDIKIEYYEGAGEAGCIISWQAPGGKREIIPEAALKHKKGAEAIEFDKAAWEKRAKGTMEVKNTASANKGGGGKPGKFDLMEFGAYQTGTVKAPYPGGNNWAYKGVSVRLTPDKKAGICYDVEGLRVSCAWTEGFLTLPKGRDGLEGQQSVSGTPKFGARQGPGWAKGDDWTDPREKTFGPLPHDWARYKGLYVNGEKIVLKYQVLGANILEMPSLEQKDGVDYFARTLNIASIPNALTMLVCEKDKAKGGVAQFGQTGGGLTGSAKDAYAWIEDSAENIIAVSAVGAPEGSTFQVTDSGRIHLKIPQGNGAKIQLVIANLPKGDINKFASTVKGYNPADLEPLTKGGPARWTEPVITKGEIGTEPGAYQMDVLTVPYDNPWKSYMRLTGMDFFKDGRIAVANIDGDVWVVSGVDDKLEKLEWKRYATGMFQPLGLKIVDDTVYVLGREQITRLHDLNKDGEADFYEAFNNDVKVQAQYHEFAHDLHTDKEGNFYYMKGSDLGAQGTIHNGTMLKVSKDGSNTDIVAVGFRAPNGMGLGPNGELTTGDNQGTWTPLCPINWVKPGGFYGHVQNLHENAKKESPRNPPICWLPMPADNSSGGQIWATSDKFGPLSGKLLHMSYGHCRLFSVMYEDTPDGEKQGGAVWFPFRFPSGIMRGRTSHIDGQVYMSGMKGWQTDAGKDGCLTRVRYTGKPAYWPVNIHASKSKKGIELTFSDPLDKASAQDVQNWSVEWFMIKRTGGYGSDELKPSDPDLKKKGREPVTVDKVTISDDGKKVFLSMPEIKEVTNMVIKYKLKGADGSEVKSEIDNTIHKLLE